MKKEKKFYQKWWFWVICIVVIGGVINSIDDNKNVKSTLNSVSDTTETEIETKTVSNRWGEILDSLLSIPSKSAIELSKNKYSNFKFRVSNRFMYDRYDDTYHYSEAERGDKYITSDITVKSSIKNPMLHGFGVYYLDKDSSLNLIGIMEYRFYRWKDYGTYLGNYSDNKNDFAYTENIRFAIGTPANEDLLKNRLFVLTRETPSFVRGFERFRNPPVFYEFTGSMLKKIDKDYEWTENGYIMICEIKKSK